MHKRLGKEINADAATEAAMAYANKRCRADSFLRAAVIICNIRYGEGMV